MNPLIFLSARPPAASGPSSPVYVMPTGDSSTQDTWDALGQGSKYVEVDDPVGSPDDETTYIQKADANGAQHFTHDGITVAESSDYTVTVHMRGRNVSGNQGIRLELVIGGTAYLISLGTGLGSTWTSRSADWTVNPATSAEWTKAEVESIQEFGLSTQFNGSGDSFRATQIYMEISWL